MYVFHVKNETSLTQQEILDLYLESVQFFYNYISPLSVEYKNKSKTSTDFHLILM